MWKRLAKAQQIYVEFPNANSVCNKRRLDECSWIVAIFNLDWAGNRQLEKHKGQDTSQLTVECSYRNLTTIINKKEDREAMSASCTMSKSIQSCHILSLYDVVTRKPKPKAHFSISTSDFPLESPFKTITNWECQWIVARIFLATCLKNNFLRPISNTARLRNVIWILYFCDFGEKSVKI